ncbi:MAG TPA: alkaline phosphatase family protein [Actinomycetota bacterium]|nr:alkaline phosphatase family protein [Actinomycetota bacterium]
MTARIPRSIVPALVAVALLATACTSDGGGSGGGQTPPRTTGEGSSTEPVEATAATGATEPGGGAAALARTACANTARDALLRTWRGMRLDRSGDVQIIPKDPNFVNGGLTHATPFDYTQEVPLLLYGPGYVRPGVYEDAVTLADLAPTLGAILDFRFDALHGTAQRQALEPADPQDLPRLVVTMIWDSGGDNVLERWPDDWPFLASLIEDGAWFTNATVGASPSNTPIGHATIGTGSFPIANGFVDEYIRINGRLQKPNENGPGFLLRPTLADLYDVANGNEPKVAAIATLAAHIMMMGHGSMWGGGDRDIAITREKEFGETAGEESVSWNLTSDMAPYYDLPQYVNELPPLDGYVEELDRADGALDGRWRENDLEALSNGFDTPARTPFQETLIETLVEREGFGADEIPDLLFLNYKAIDTVGHLFSASGIEMSDAVRQQDETLETFVSFLDETVGEGEWVLALTADHGTQEDPETSGAFMIDINKLESGLTENFDDQDGTPLVQKVRPTEVWLDRDELRENGFTLFDVSEWFLALTQEDTFKNRNLPQPGREQETVFAAALPSSILSSLPCLPQAQRAEPVP